MSGTSIRHAPGRLGRAATLLLAAVLTVTATAAVTAVSAVNAPPAFADGHISFSVTPVVGGGTGGGDTSTGGNGGGDSGGSDNTYYGCTSACPTVGVDYSANQVYFPNQPPPPPGDAPAYSGQCSGGNQYGPYIGVNYTYTVDTQGGQVIGNGETTNETEYLYFSAYSCISAPAYVTRSTTCGWTVGARGTGPYLNNQTPKVATGVIFEVPAAPTPFNNSGGTNLSLCKSSYSRTFVAKPMSAYGIYYLKGLGTQVTCSYRAYTTADPRTGSIPSPLVTGCSSPYSVSQAQSALTIFCGGWQRGANTAHTFDSSECVTNGTVSCTVSAPRLGGSPINPASRFGDGKPHTLTWGTPVVKGATGVRLTDHSLHVDPKSTPYDAKASEGNQPFSTVPSWTSSAPGFNSTWQVKWFDRSTPSGTGVLPWIATTSYRYTADFPSTAVTVTSFNTETQAYTVVTAPTTVVTTGACQGAPMRVELSRSANTTN